MPYWNRQLYVDPMAILILSMGVKTSKHCEKNVLCHYLSLKTVVFLLLSIKFGLVWEEIIINVQIEPIETTKTN